MTGLAMPREFNPGRSFLKAVAIALISGAIGFFLGVFLGIVGLAVAGFARKATPDFSLAYRVVGLTLGSLGAVAGFAASVYRDLRGTDMRQER